MARGRYVIRDTAPDYYGRKVSGGQYYATEQRARKALSEAYGVRGRWELFDRETKTVIASNREKL